MASLRAINQLDNGKIPIFGYRHNGIWALGEYFIAKSAERRGRSWAGPQTMFDIFFKEVWTLFTGRHKTGPCEAS